MLLSTDGGNSFAPLADAPTLLTIAPDPTRTAGLVGLTPEGELWIGAAAPNAGWGKAPGVIDQATDIAVSNEGTIAVATPSDVISTRDEGTTWTTVISAS